MGKVGAIILAAGGSRRLGQPKQLLQSNEGETLVHSAVRAAIEGGCEPVCVVTGEAHEPVARAVSDLHPIVIRNQNWSRGIGSSIRTGLGQISGVTAVVLLACDQPALSAAVIRALTAKYEETGRAIIASRYADTLGIPAMFDRSCFAELENLPDEFGAKKIIAAEPARVASIEFAEGRRDLDSQADVKVWCARRRAQEN